MKRVNEGTAFILPVILKDADGEAVVPSTFRYRLDCETTGREILGWTTLAPASTINITITGSQNAILNRGNKAERKLITVEADSGLSTVFTDDYLWEVKRLDGFS